MLKPFENFLYGSYDRKINNLSISYLESFKKNREHCIICEPDNFMRRKYDMSYFNLCYDHFKISPESFY